MPQERFLVSLRFPCQVSNDYSNLLVCATKCGKLVSLLGNFMKKEILLGLTCQVANYALTCGLTRKTCYSFTKTERYIVLKIIR